MMLSSFPAVMLQCRFGLPSAETLPEHNAATKPTIFTIEIEEIGPNGIWAN